MTIAALRWFKAALVLQVLLVGYWLAIGTLPLSPWNDLAALPTDSLRTDIAFNALPLLVFLLFFALGSTPLAVISVIGYAGFLVWQLWIWWRPFAMGADAAWQAEYAAGFSRTLKVIPSFGTHLAPDAQHLAMQLLALATLIVTWIAARHMRHL